MSKVQCRKLRRSSGVVFVRVYSRLPPSLGLWTLDFEYGGPTSSDAHRLQLCSMSADDIYRAARHLKRLSEEANQFLVGSAINWRCGDSNAQRAVVFADKFAARSTGNNPDLEDQFSVFVRVIDHLEVQCPMSKGVGCTWNICRPKARCPGRASYHFDFGLWTLDFGLF